MTFVASIWLFEWQTLWRLPAPRTGLFGVVFLVWCFWCTWWCRPSDAWFWRLEPLKVRNRRFDDFGRFDFETLPRLPRWARFSRASFQNFSKNFWKIFTYILVEVSCVADRCDFLSFLERRSVAAASPLKVLSALAPKSAVSSIFIEPVTQTHQTGEIKVKVA